ncbi:unnamed protein product, partial [Ectocarpus sp. 12 AP-2014]
DGGADAARRSSRAAGLVAGGQGPPSPAAGVSTVRQPPTIASFAAQQAVEAATAARKAAAADVALSRRLEEAASARAEEAHRDIVAQKRKAVAARSENAELVRAQREACERRAAELRTEQRALELLEADGRQLIADANVARGQRERVYRHAAARVCERRTAREEAERRVRAVRGEGHATARMAESVLSAEGRSMRPVPLLRDPVEIQRVTDKRAERAAHDAEALRKVSASDMATIKAVAKSRVRKVVHDAFPV